MTNRIRQSFQGPLTAPGRKLQSRGGHLDPGADPGSTGVATETWRLTANRKRALLGHVTIQKRDSRNVIAFLKKTYTYGKLHIYNLIMQDTWTERIHPKVPSNHESSLHLPPPTLAEYSLVTEFGAGSPGGHPPHLCFNIFFWRRRVTRHQAEDGAQWGSDAKAVEKLHCK